MTGGIPGAGRAPLPPIEAARRAADPATPAHELETLAADVPSTRPLVAANPSAPPFVLRFLASFRDPAIDAALAGNAAAVRALAILDAPTPGHEDGSSSGAVIPVVVVPPAVVAQPAAVVAAPSGPASATADPAIGLDPFEGRRFGIEVATATQFADQPPTTVEAEAGPPGSEDDVAGLFAADEFGPGSLPGAEPDDGVRPDDAATGEVPIVDSVGAWPAPIFGAGSDEDPATAAEPTPITGFLGGGTSSAAAARQRHTGVPRSAAIVLLPILLVLGVLAVVGLGRSLGFGGQSPKRLGAARTVPTLPARPLPTVPFGPSAAPGPASSATVIVVASTAAATTEASTADGAPGAAATAAPAPDPTAADAGSTATDGPAATTLRPAVLPITVKPTTTTLKPTTASQPGLSLDLADPSVQKAGAVAQQLLNAFATGDWSTARRLQPGDTTSNAQYEKTFTDLHDGTVVLAKAVSTGGGGYSIRLGIVAHQGFSGPRTTALSCAHWDIDVGATTVHRMSSVPVRTATGTVDADAVSGELRSTCASAPLT